MKVVWWLGGTGNLVAQACYNSHDSELRMANGWLLIARGIHVEI